MRTVEEQKRQLNNQGITLVEVLLCLAIISIVFLAVMHAFGVSARVNLKANKVQVVTAFAHKIIEECKSADIVDEVLLQYGGRAKEPEKNSDAYLALTPNQQMLCTKDMFTITKYNVLDVPIKGAGKFHVEVITNPLPYSQFVDDKTGNAKVMDANIFGTPNIRQIDDAGNAVIKDEINRYDAAVVEELQTLLPDTMKDGTDTQRTALKAAMAKNVTVTIENVGTDCIHVKAEAEYCSAYEGYSVEKSYVLYQASYPLEIKTRRVLDFATGRPIEVFEKYEKGGEVFIFASAMNGINQNTMKIENRITLANPITVSLVRGGALNEANFNQIILADTFNEMVYADTTTASVKPSGLAAIYNMNFYSNVKGIQNDYIRQEDLDATLHDTAMAYRCYDITVNIYDRDTGETVVSLTATQER